MRISKHPDQKISDIFIINKVTFRQTFINDRVIYIWNESHIIIWGGSSVVLTKSKLSDKKDAVICYWFLILLSKNKMNAISTIRSWTMTPYIYDLFVLLYFRWINVKIIRVIIIITFSYYNLMLITLTLDSLTVTIIDIYGYQIIDSRFSAF